MKILNKIFGGALEKVSDVVDKFVMTKEEKHAARVEIEKIFIEAENETQRNVTERWKADASSDSWLTLVAVQSRSFKALVKSNAKKKKVFWCCPYT